MLTEQTPDPVPLAWWCNLVASMPESDAVASFHCYPDNWRAWLSGAKPIPWIVAELARVGPSPAPAILPPDPVPMRWWHANAGQVRAVAGARMLHVDDRTWSRWWAGSKPIPWAAAEVMRRMLLELPAGSPLRR